MNHEGSTSEGELIEMWVDQEPTETILIPKGEFSLSGRNFNTISSTHTVSLAIQEVPVRLRSESAGKYIDVTVMHDLPLDSFSQFVLDTASCWSIENLPASLKLAKPERLVRTLLESVEFPHCEISLFEAKKKLNHKALGQIQNYEDFFIEYYSDSGEFEIIKTGIIYIEEDEMLWRTAARRGIELWPVHSQ